MFNLNYPQNSLQALPVHDLDDREFHILNGSCHLQIENLKDLDLYNLLPNPDKSDDVTLIIYQLTLNLITMIFPVWIRFWVNQEQNPFHVFLVNISSLSKNISLLEDTPYSLSEQPDVLGVSETRLNANTTLNTQLTNYNINYTKLFLQPWWEGLLFMSVKL